MVGQFMHLKIPKKKKKKRLSNLLLALVWYTQNLDNQGHHEQVNVVKFSWLDFVSLEGFKNPTIGSEVTAILPEICWIGVFFSMVELHWEGSDTKRATLSSLTMNCLSLVSRETRRSSAEIMVKIILVFSCTFKPLVCFQEAQNKLHVYSFLHI